MSRYRCEIRAKDAHGSAVAGLTDPDKGLWSIYLLWTVVRYDMCLELTDPEKGLWSMYLLGFVVRYDMYPQFGGSLDA